jgi:hypothetical protein
VEANCTNELVAVLRGTHAHGVKMLLPGTARQAGSSMTNEERAAPADERAAVKAVKRFERRVMLVLNVLLLRHRRFLGAGLHCLIFGVQLSGQLIRSIHRFLSTSSVWL